MFGSFGWGLAMLCVGFVLDHSAMIGSHPCDVRDAHERNYTYCFAAFTTFMGIATITATRFKLKDLPNNLFGPGSMRQGFPAMNQQPMDTQYTSGTASHIPAEYDDEGMLDAPIITTTAANDLDQGDNNPMRTDYGSLLAVFRTYANVKFYVMLATGWFFGFGTALTFSYQFWHLQVRCNRSLESLTRFKVTSRLVKESIYLQKRFSEASQIWMSVTALENPVENADFTQKTYAKRRRLYFRDLN